jgi:DNA-binding IscR family transcriptional regulator
VQQQPLQELATRHQKKFLYEAFKAPLCVLDIAEERSISSNFLRRVLDHLINAANIKGVVIRTDRPARKAELIVHEY